VSVAIVDDGLERNNADLVHNFAPDLSYDFNYNRADPTPLTAIDSHGTMASCMACAEANNNCGVGSAPQCRIAGIKILGKAISDAGEANGLGYKCIGPKGQTNDIYSCSWGPPDDGQRLGMLSRFRVSLMSLSRWTRTPCSTPN
jgi:kexin